MFLDSVLLCLILLNLETSALKCYRCGTLTPASGPGHLNATTEGDKVGRHRRGADIGHPSHILELESCNEFEKPGSPTYLYEVTCGDDGLQFCTKIVTYSYEPEDTGGGEEETSSYLRKRTAQRGCAYAVTASGQSHPIGCGYLQPPLASSANGKILPLMESEHICYCDSNYCNSAPSFQTFCSLHFYFLPLFLNYFLTSDL